MDVQSAVAVTGFLSRTPQLKQVGAQRVSLFVTQLGQKRFRREEDGSFTLIGTVFVELVLIGSRAEAAVAQFERGDDVIATGEFKNRAFEYQGQQVERLQFRATRIVLDTSRARYTVQRTPRAVMSEAARLGGETDTPVRVSQTQEPLFLMGR